MTSSNQPGNTEMKEISTKRPIWSRFFTVNPLVVVGSKEPDGSYDLAPKHMAIPMGWQNYFGFVCTPEHGTYHNAKREGEFSVSYPKPSQLLLTSLSASPRCDDNSKPQLNNLPTTTTQKIDSVCLKDAYIHLECTLDRIIDGFGDNSLIVGSVIGARVDKKALRRDDRDDQNLIFDSPLLAYLEPGRYTIINESQTFPFPKDFSR